MLNGCSSVFDIHFYVFPYNNFIINRKIKNFSDNGLIMNIEEKLKEGYHCIRERKSIC